jgi:hypothetical protein
MSWIRLYIVVEGQSEREFVNLLLKPHLSHRAIDVRPRVVETNRKLNMRGGLLNFEILRKDLERLMREDRSSDARFTTMIDLYGLPASFPGRDDAAKRVLRADRVATLEAAFQAALGDPRFSPYIQVHEFEALLYCDLDTLHRRIDGAEAGLRALTREVGGKAPEDINDGASTAPSKRLIKHVPSYARLKVRVGAPAAASIGLPTLRAKCPHFDDWVTRLERMGTNPSVILSADA